MTNMFDTAVFVSLMFILRTFIRRYSQSLPRLPRKTILAVLALSFLIDLIVIVMFFSNPRNMVYVMICALSASLVVKLVYLCDEAHLKSTKVQKYQSPKVPESE